MVTRASDRAGFAEDVRIRLLESDMDQKDDQYEELRNEIKGLQRVMVGMLISLATASILLALNIVLSGN